MIDEDDAIAERLDLVHLMGGHDDRSSGLRLLLR